MIDVIILFFIFGIAVGVLKINLSLPKAIYDVLVFLLLISIGLKGGVELAKQPLFLLFPQVLVTLLLGFILPFLAYPILRYLGKLSRSDSASIAAHYGSVSVGTFAVAISFLISKNIYFEEYMALFLVLLESPAIIAGIILAKGLSGNVEWLEVLHDAFLDKGIILMLGGLLIGWIVGPTGLEPILPMFFGLFKGMLSIFLFEMGIIASSQLSSLKRNGFFLLFFGILTPILFAFIGAILGLILGFSLGGITIFMTLAASASYIAVPAAMRLSIPEANPTLSLASSLGITFTFNVLFGITLYYKLAQKIFVFWKR